MGIFQPEETHESRSSSKSFALRWKHENLRQMALIAIFSIALAIMILLVVYGQAGKQVSLVIDGKAQVVETRTGMLQEMLEEQSITVSPHDKVSMPMNGAITDGDRIIIERAVPVKITADGDTKTLYTTDSSVQGVIQQSGIEVANHDKVYPALGTAIKADMKIRVVRVTKHTVDVKQPIAYKVVKTADPSLFQGDNRVVVKGKEGTIVQHIEKVFQDGELVSKKVVGKTVASNRVDKVIAVGTKAKPVVKEPEVQLVSAKTSTAKKAVTTNSKKTSASGSKVITVSGNSFKYSKVLKNVSMTAYSSEEPGIGTKTASGTRVTEGRTIAVDPKVIPIGWWVYIEGLGFRRAEDTGGAIKGNKIDVYYDSVKHALNFGRKKGKTVYVIGPVKPEAN
ncbi:ubiquitin-like domain-containing protein [Paenibacillus sp. RRE4]|uniref:ubiquitin-like domain-containing protein n=1 Tax=Paenibacillus sp. RRE4 TaxID=2962587 RepID=UPI002881A50A|nr:ubiquitin-like domain-containing protein [Paenibacillus sp. RRE4]MDT0126237.1 ubiquitin-like domain-containing protein [Paenibacillus sp. RRE4]